MNIVSTKIREYTLVSKRRSRSWLIILHFFAFLGAFLPVFGQNDSLQTKIDYGFNPNITETITYSAKDTAKAMMQDDIIELKNQAKVNYGDFQLEAGYIRVDMKAKMVYATGILDSNEQIIQKPIFTQGNKIYEVDTVRFNLESKKGKIKTLHTQEGEGYVKGIDIKRMPDESFNLKQGIYTTCNHPEPHYYIRAKRMKFTKDKKIFTGPARLVIGGVETPLLLPFAYFPLSEKKTFGILMPSYNFSRTRGFSLNGLGIYLGLSEYWDNKMEFDIFSSGGYNIRNFTRYKKRYGFYGDVQLSLSHVKNIEGVLGATKNHYKLIWNHRQDAKANPYGRFSANVNIQDANYNLVNNVNLNNKVTNEFQSTITYDRNIFNNALNISLTGTHHLSNSENKPVDITLPELNIRTNGNIYPFKKLFSSDSKNFLKKLSINPSLQSKYMVNTYDSLMFTDKMFQDDQIGAYYNVPINIQLKATSALSFTPTMGYRGYLYRDRFSYSYNDALQKVDTSRNRGLHHAYDFNAGLGVNFSPKIIGIFNFGKDKKITAMRHIISPSLSYSYGFNFLDRNRYHTYINETQEWYNHFDEAVYSVPTSPSLKNQNSLGSINLRLANDLDVKIRSNEKDTTNGGFKTIKRPLFSAFDFNTSYSLDADSFALSDIQFNYNFGLIKGLNLIGGADFNPYQVRDGKSIDKYFFQKGGGFAEVKTARAGLSYTFNSKSKTGNSTMEKIAARRAEGNLTPFEEQQLDEIERFSSRYVDFDVPYSLTTSYSFRYTKKYDTESEKSHILNFDGNVSLTNSLKVNFATGYDILKGEFSHSSFGLIKDLHCWRMSFNWIPTGIHESFTFEIAVKASVLQDLKLTKNGNSFDNNSFF
ncbi:MAG: putative LPS assembly protein LptD [Flavobacteriales bacterium]|nr:putative LPS assembly protein LptD [Flavobacteriales bacterium]